MARTRADGFTLLEVLAASIVASVVAGGMLMAYMAAARMLPPTSTEDSLEAGEFAQQTLEGIRNHVATDDNYFAMRAGAGWQDDVLPAPSSSQSILNAGAERRFCVVAADCDGVGGTGDCYAVSVKLCWDGTSCPAAGTACP